MLEMLTRAPGHWADGAAHGIEAIQAPERRPCDVVLRDGKMQGNGWAAGGRIIHKHWQQGAKN